MSLRDHAKARITLTVCALVLVSYVILMVYVGLDKADKIAGALAGLTIIVGTLGGILKFFNLLHPMLELVRELVRRRSAPRQESAASGVRPRR